MRFCSEFGFSKCRTVGMTLAGRRSSDPSARIVGAYAAPSLTTSIISLGSGGKSAAVESMSIATQLSAAVLGQ